MQWQQPSKRVGPVLQYTVAYAPVNTSIAGAVTMLPDEIPYVRRLQYSSLTTMCRLQGLYTGHFYVIWVWSTTWTASGSAKGLPSSAVIAKTDGIQKDETPNSNAHPSSSESIQNTSTGIWTCQAIHVMYCDVTEMILLVLLQAASKCLRKALGRVSLSCYWNRRMGPCLTSKWCSKFIARF